MVSSVQRSAMVCAMADVRAPVGPKSSNGTLGTNISYQLEMMSDTVSKALASFRNCKCRPMNNVIVA